MFRKLGITDSEANLEAAEVQIFLRNSVELKKMKEIAAKQAMSKYREFPERLKKCTSFSGLVHACGPSFDIANHDDVVIQSIGRNGVNAMCFVSGFFSDAWSYKYFGLHFYESVLTYLEEKNRSGNLAHNFN